MIIRKLKYLIVSLFVGLSMGLVAVPAVASADFKSDACSGLSDLGGAGCKSHGGGISHIIKFVVNMLSIAVGAAALIMIIIGGLKFITSGGDSSATASARSTLIFALVGLIIVAIAQIIVHFVIQRVATAG